MAAMLQLPENGRRGGHCHQSRSVQEKRTVRAVCLAPCGHCFCWKFRWEGECGFSNCLWL